MSAEHNHSHHHHHEADECCAVPAYQPTQAALQAVAGQQLTRVRIEQMDCPVEEQLIRKRFDGQAEVLALQFNLMQRQLECFIQRAIKRSC